MKNLLFIAAGLLFIKTVSAQYRPEDRSSVVSFTINNFGFPVDGNFTGIRGSIDFDPQHPEAARFDVSVDASTVNTGNSLRDSHLRNDSYFDAKNYPRIRLKSTAVSASGKAGCYLFTGALTIKDVTQTIRFPFNAKTAGETVNFTGTFAIRRKDFHVGGTSTISDDLTVSLNVLAVK